MSTQVSAGDRVLALVHPSRNAGRRVTAAIVTHVEGDTAEVQLLLPGESPRASGVKVYADRTAAVKAVAEHFKDLPGHSTDDEGNVIPGTNPTTGRPWQDYDVLHWVTACWPAAAHPAVGELQQRVADVEQSHVEGSGIAADLESRVIRLEAALASSSSSPSTPPAS